MPLPKKGNFIEENVAIILKFCIRDPDCPSSFKKIKVFNIPGTQSVFECSYV